MAHPFKLFLALLILAVGGAFWWKLRPVSYRYLLTVTVDTPRGARIGSGVQEIGGRAVLIKLPDGEAAKVDLRGEAVPLEISEGKYLFALLTSEGEESIIPAVQSAFDPEYRRGGDGNIATIQKVAGARDITTHPLARTNSFEQGERPFLPRLVTFKDIQNPRSIVEVEPDGLAAEFGAGTVLKSVTVAKTTAPLTHTIIRLLPWLGSKPSTLDAGWTGSVNPTLPQRTSYRDFKRD
jgi:hypothetical protein